MQRAETRSADQTLTKYSTKTPPALTLVIRLEWYHGQCFTYTSFYCTTVTLVVSECDNLLLCASNAPNTDHGLAKQGLLERMMYYSQNGCNAPFPARLIGCKLVILGGHEPRLLGRLIVIDLVIADTSPHGPYAAFLDKSQVPPMSGLHMFPLMGTRAYYGCCVSAEAFQGHFRLNLGKMIRFRVYETQLTTRTSETHRFCTRFMVSPGRS
jgi:hypothetical protein